MKIEWKKLLISLALPLAVGGLSAWTTGGYSDSFSELNQPPLSPPGWLFPVVWGILYLLMGYASYRIWTGAASLQKKGRALAFYLGQLVLNFLWSPLFFRWELRLAAFFLLLGLWLAVLLTIRRFSQIDETAGDLLIPYVLWIIFAGYLNLGVFLLN